MGYELKQVRPGVWELVVVEDKPKEVSLSPLPGPPKEALRVARDAALKRLMRDWRELQRCPLPTVAAVPLENNFFEWHGNMLATSESSFCGLVYHIIMRFPDTYPLQPPTVELKGYISHPNVFGSYICLDMLENGWWGMESVREQRYTGWSTAYSVTSILIQLQNFISGRSRNVKGERERAEKSMKCLVCSCGHVADGNTYPPIAPEVIEQEMKQRERGKAAKATTVRPPPPKSAAKPTAASIADVNFSEILGVEAPPSAGIHYGLFRRYREDSFPIRLPRIKAPAGSGSRATEAIIGWREANIQSSFRSLAVDLFTAERGYTVYEVTFDDRRSRNPFLDWGEVYPEHDLHNIKDGHLAKLGVSNAKRSVEEILAQKNPYQFPARADTIDFCLRPGGRAVHRMSARYNLTHARSVANTAWKLVAVDESNGRNLLVLNVISNGFNAHFISSAQFYLYTTASDNGTPSPAPVPAVDTKKEVSGAANGSGVSGKQQQTGRTPSAKSVGASEQVVLREVKEERPVKKYVPTSTPLIVSANFGPLRPKTSAAPAPAPAPATALHVFSYLSKDDLFTAFKVIHLDHFFATTPTVNAEFADLALDSPQWGKDELVCFHSKRTDEEDTLGFPINFTLYPPPIPSATSPAPVRPYRNIESISSTLDLLSYESYKVESVRRGVWKEHFTHWLPVYIGRQHGKKALPLCEQLISVIMTGDPNLFQPIMAVEVFTKLMNTMIVSLMSGATHASEKAMEGYFSFHHWLLVFIERYPQLLDWINNRIRGFITDPEKRIKKVCLAVPSLGEFIPLLAVTDAYQWQDVAEPLILEVFDRNVKWVLQKYPALGNMQSGGQLDVDKYRLLKTFEASQVSMRLILFHAYFLNTIAKPKGRTVSLVRRVLDACYGRPSPRMKVLLQKRTKELQKVDNWVDFFVRIDMPLPSPERLTRWLRQSVWNSSRKRYHNRHAYTGSVRNPRRARSHQWEEEEEDEYHYDRYE
ncbi:Ubiquitinconjugating enzyme subfamily protein [Acanthamoeba castellanii str. Neff]|uniref:Ubiquitinconjugating enzyme subfamily protein n=1 Tax=Acanthamoeba castellanii (strain ATCC 30010 / Neff) TaxID=1257118 RepID=L8GV71_ACACF|nr:Ubiquitinconjugating enzyme subfamily protein [Acanthamoeba castellanii str. Neff]ELR16842.1 Ubiquitinconjugating enzyme subfamily protein [Acanthamoeba castellanii str. Neff]